MDRIVEVWITNINESDKQRLMDTHDINEALAGCYLRCRHLGFICYGCPLDSWCEEIDMEEKDLKVFAMMTKAEKLKTMWRVAAMVADGKTTAEIAAELDIPESEIRACEDAIKEGVK